MLHERRVAKKEMEVRDAREKAILAAHTRASKEDAISAETLRLRAHRPETSMGEDAEVAARHTGDGRFAELHFDQTTLDSIKTSLLEKADAVRQDTERKINVIQLRIHGATRMLRTLGEHLQRSSMVSSRKGEVDDDVHRECSAGIDGSRGHGIEDAAVDSAQPAVLLEEHSRAGAERDTCALRLGPSTAQTAQIEIDGDATEEPTQSGVQEKAADGRNPSAEQDAEETAGQDLEKKVRQEVGKIARQDLEGKASRGFES